MLHNIFDAHAHYDDKWFDEDRSALLSSMPENGVSYIVNAAVDIATAKTAIGYTEQYPHLYACAGIHPENLDGLEDDYLDQLTELLRHPKVVALGEIGLDYHWDIEKPLQQRVFEEQLRLAKELSVPVVIHDREAHGDVMELVRKYQPKGLMHCYSGSVEMLKEVIKLGMSIFSAGRSRSRTRAYPWRSLRRYRSTDSCLRPTRRTSPPCPIAASATTAAISHIPQRGSQRSGEWTRRS